MIDFERALGELENMMMVIVEQPELSVLFLIDGTRS